MNDISNQFVPAAAPPDAANQQAPLEVAAEVVYQLIGLFVVLPLALVAAFIGSYAAATGSCAVPTTADMIQHARINLLVVGLGYSLVVATMAVLGAVLKRFWYPWAAWALVSVGLTIVFVLRVSSASVAIPCF